MSATPEPEPEGDESALATADGWRSLSSEEQDSHLEGALEDELGGEVGEPLEKADARTAKDQILDKVRETWTATVLEDVELELYTPTSNQIEEIHDIARTFYRVEDAEDVEDVDESDLDRLDRISDELNRLYGGDPEAEDGSPEARGLVASEGMDFAFWEAKDYPPELRLEVFAAIFGKYAQDMRRIRKFREK